MNKKGEKQFKSDRLLVLIRWGIFISLFMPLIIDDKFIFPFIFPKQAFFQIVIEILMGLYIFLALRNPDYRPRSSKLFWALGFYFIFLFLSSVFGVNSYHSFWSNYERMAGMISLLHYFGFLLLVANVFKIKEDWYRFFDFSIIASALQALYGAGQLLGFQSLIHGSGERVDGTIGNPSFLAGYMLINSLFAFWLILEKKKMSWRIFYTAVIILNLFILYQTQTRGAMLALIIAVFALSFLFIFASREALAQLPLRNPGWLKKITIAVFVLFFLVGSIIWFYRDSEFIQNQPTLSRLTHISFQEGTTLTRLMAWKMSWQGFKERPFFGWGLENYYIVFNKYYNPNLYPVESWFDRSHNAYLDVLVHTGLFGFLAYLAMFILAFWYLWQRWRRGKLNYHTWAIFTVILVAYGVQNIFLFDTQVTLLMIFSIMAFILFLSFEGPPEKTGQAFKPNILLIAAVAFLVLVSIYFFNVKPGLAGAKGIEALYVLQLKSPNNISLAAKTFRQAYEIGTFGLPEIAARAADTAMQALQLSVSDSVKKELVEVAIEGIEKSFKMEPDSARVMLMLSNLYLGSISFEPSYLQEADLNLQRAIELSPTRQELYYSLGQLRMYQGRKSEVLPLFKKALDLNNKVALSHWNYGIMAIGLGQKELGEAEIKEAIKRGHSYDAKDMKFLINAYNNIQDWQKIISLYQDWIELTPTDATPYAGLAAAYAQIGEKEKAKEMALKAVEIDPQFQAEAEQFIKNLGL